MKRTLILVLCLGLACFSIGCQNTKTRAAEGAGIGAVIGAAAGGIIGHQSHHGAEGAAIGAAVGAVTGALAGSQIQKSQQAVSATQAAQPAQTVNPNQMSIQQILDLSRQRVHEDVIIDKIRLTSSRFSLTAQDIDYLRSQGVSLKIIDAMQGR